MSLLSFNPSPKISIVPIIGGSYCVVVDDALLNPDHVVDYAQTSIDDFVEPLTGGYPGCILGLASADSESLQDFIRLNIADVLGVGVKGGSLSARLSMVTSSAEHLKINQRMCHVDTGSSLGVDELNFESVMYLFKDPELGGTSFFGIKKKGSGPAGLNWWQARHLYQQGAHKQLKALSPFFSAPPEYITDTNEFAQLLRVIPPKFNRMIFYPSNQYHSGDIKRPHSLVKDPVKGRLTINTFFTGQKSKSKA